MAVRAVSTATPGRYSRTEFIYIGEDEPLSQLVAPAHQENLGTPLNSMNIIREHRDELTPGTEQIYGQALLSLVKPGCSSRLMEESDAKASLKYVAGKVVTRAEKRKAEAAAAAEAEEARNMEMGALRAAKRAAIAARPGPTAYWVDNVLCPHAY